MRRPRIGIPLGLDDRGRWRSGRSYLYIDRSYADAISRAGGLPLHLPIQEDVVDLVEGLDGLLLPGGDDLAAESSLGERAVEDIELDLVPPPQLAFDAALLRAALRRRRPVLGICYGMQLLVRDAGGALIIHLPSQTPEADPHKLPSDEGRHPISIEPGSRLARVFGGCEASVNSLHHQGVARVGSRHRIVARSPDGVIEAIESAAGAEAFELGVQWHPEKMDGPLSRAIFDDFVAACLERARKQE